MAPSTVDLLFVTFNCAKNLVDPNVFGHHLHTTFRENADTLPDLVVL